MVSPIEKLSPAEAVLFNIISTAAGPNILACELLLFETLSASLEDTDAVFEIINNVRCAK